MAVSGFHNLLTLEEKKDVRVHSGDVFVLSHVRESDDFPYQTVLLAAQYSSDLLKLINLSSGNRYFDFDLRYGMDVQDALQTIRENALRSNDITDVHHIPRLQYSLTIESVGGGK